jgi:predicted ATPase/class 3 adenylate cyclase
MSSAPDPERALPTGPVTFLFTDIEGSTRRWEADPVTMRKVLERHDSILTQGIEGTGGRALLDRGEGDSFFAVFARPADAVAAALLIQKALLAEPWPDGAPVLVRMAIHTGQAGDDYRGPDTNRAARIRAIGHGGQVLLSHSTQALLQGALPDGATLLDLGEHGLKDVTLPERVFQLAHPDLLAEFPRLKSMNMFRQNLPATVTSFIGRERELGEVRRLVRESRLVTLTGSGGTGKTRLALEVAGELIDDCPGGVCFVDLASLTEGEWVPQAVAAALGLREDPGRSVTQVVVEHLAPARALVLLDNCEHLVEACSRLADSLLAACPQLSILCTSTEALNIAGEVAWRVPPLGVPAAADSLPADRLAEYEAIRLFVDRATAGRPDFMLTDQNGAAVAQVCRRLDGIPLAIELAAARIRAMSPEEILRRLDDRFRLLTGGGRTAMARQQTLQAAVDWSHTLLEDQEKVLFRRLSVFAGGFRLEAAEAVGAGDPLAPADVLDLLVRLVDKSLVIADEVEGTTRYRMLETLRQYGKDRLAESTESEAVHQLHFEHFLGLADDAYSGRVTDAIAWLNRLETERENIRAALDWSATAGDGRDLELAGALPWFWGVRGPFREASERLEEALRRNPEASPGRARGLRGAGELAMTQGDFSAARRWLEESVAAWRQLDAGVEVAHTLERLGLLEWAEGDADAVTRRFGEILPTWREIGDDRRACYALMMLGQAACMRGDYAEGARRYRELDELARRLGDPRSLMYANHSLSDLALFEGDQAAAFDGYVRGLARAREFGDVSWMTYELEGQAMAAAGIARPLRSARLAGAAAAQRQKIGLGLMSPWWTRLQDDWLGAARRTLGPESTEAALAEGREMGFDAAVAYGLDASQD